jgi:hypothetical protein
MMNLDWTHLCTGANGTNMSSCIGGTARSPLNDLRTSVQPHGASDSQHVSGLPPLWHEAMFACGPRYFQSSINMHSPRATYERVECFGRILNESRADTMTVVMRYHARGTARSLGHQRPVLRGLAEGTPWDKMQVISEKTYSMLLTEMVTSFIICFVLVISMFDLGSFVMRIFTYSYLFWMSSFKKCLRYSIRCASCRCTYYVLEFLICPVTYVVVYSAMITVTVTLSITP